MSFMNQYKKYGKLMELDVRDTIDKDIKQIEDEKRIEKLRRENAAK